MTKVKIIATLLIATLIFPLSAEAGDQFLSTKTVGKLTMIAILSVTAFVVKILCNRDRNEAAELRQRFGEPEKHIEFQDGLDHWRVEWYEGRAYTFRNDVLYKPHLQENH